jgi:hypothetical protein
MPGGLPSAAPRLSGMDLEPGQILSARYQRTSFDFGHPAEGRIGIRLHTAHRI